MLVALGSGHTPVPTSLPSSPSLSVSSPPRADPSKQGPSPPPDLTEPAPNPKEEIATANAIAGDERCNSADEVGPALWKLQAIPREHDLFEKAATAAYRLVQCRVQIVKEILRVANAVGTDHHRCDTATEVAAAWSNLQRIPRENSFFEKAAAPARRLEHCRSQLVKEFIRAGREAMVVQRKNAAHDVERRFLNENVDADVVTRGERSTQLIMKNVLFTRLWAYKLTEAGKTSPGSFLAGLQNMGFKRATFTDGFGKSFYYDLAPLEEGAVFGKTLQPMGLAEPLKL
jgi:hypothetical protein